MRRWMRISPSILLCFLWILPPNPTLAEESWNQKGLGGTLFLTSFAVSWIDDNNTFRAGDVATIKIRPFDTSFDNRSFDLGSYAVNFSLSVNGKKGNSSYVSGVFPYLEGEFNGTLWSISLTTIRVGEFNVVITEDHSGITDSSLHFTVTAGQLYPSACMASWMNLVNEFVAGTKAYLSVLPKDAFGNNILSGMDIPRNDYFKVNASYENGSVADLLDFRYNGWNELGYIGVEFVPTTAGSLLLHVYGDNQTLSGSPLTFVVKPESLDVSNCVGKWKYDINSLQVFSNLEFFIYQKDRFGNLVADFYSFDARVVEKATNLSIPVADLLFQEVAHGIQLVSFLVSEPGEFMLTIFDAKLNKSVSNVSYHYTVFIGYCHGLNSFVNGSGLAHSVAGRMSYFTVHLEDLYHNPSPVVAERLHVQILSKNGTFAVRPILFPLRSFNAPGPVAGQNYFANGPAASVPALPGNENKTFIVKSTVEASDFNVAYTPEKSGDYEIRVSCGNIPLNDGHSYSMKVSPGMVDTSLSWISNFVPNVKRGVKNEVMVKLMDALLNPVSSHKTQLSFQIEPSNDSSFLTWTFVDNEDGSYVGYYVAKDIGTYNMCVSVEDKNLSPCPFEIHVYDREYFPDAYDDSITVWEDESVAFDALSNDYIPGGHVSIETSMPFHGSLLKYGQLFRYTPYAGFFGNDTFTYTISDINKNVATGTVFVSVLCKPPQFVLLPVRLHVTEDVINPKFGGFPGFEIMYSDVRENITITIRAQSGITLLAPTPMQLCQPLESILSVSRGGRTGRDLILAGYVEIINSALQFIQYLGNENFYGNDIISLYAANKNGIQDAHVPVFVEPINDAPIIHAPKFILLGRKAASDRLQIFDKQRDVFLFSIVDPDIFNFPGNKSYFLVTFSVEVNDGTLSIRLPVHLINSAELKIKSSDQWQPLQTFVTISQQFVLKGKGVRFRGTIDDCNNAMQRIFYQGADQGDILTVTVNDMGNYGCYPDCTEMMSLPLSTEVTVNLIQKRPISSVTALLLGSAIIIEIVTMLILGGVLLFFICKCMNALHRERRDCVDKANDALSQNVTCPNGRSSPLSLGSHRSNFRQRSLRGSKVEVSSKGDGSTSQLSDGRRQLIPLSVERDKLAQMD